MRITIRTLCAGPFGTMSPGITYDVAEGFGLDPVAGGDATRMDDDAVEVHETEVAPEPDDSELTEEQEDDITLPRGRRRSTPREAEPQAEPEETP